MATKKKPQVQWGKAKTTGERASKTDDQKDQAKAKHESRDSRRSPSKIKPRASGSTREVNPLHVLELAESIEALGLLQPIAIDKKNQLIAGEHRLIACQILALKDENDRIKHWESIKLSSSKHLNSSKKIEEANERLKKLNHGKFITRYKDLEIPVLVLPFDSSKDIERSLLAETAENEKRINYSRDEIRKIADKLRDAGYIERAGRPKEGEKSLKNALTVISGKSWRQIYRDMNEEKTLTSVRVFDEKRELVKISNMISKFGLETPENHELDKPFKEVLVKIEQRLNTIAKLSADAENI